MKRAVQVSAALAAVAIVAAACGSKPKDDNGGGDNNKASFNGCLVTDTGGIDDRSFNQSAAQALRDVKSQGVSPKFEESKSDSDYKPNIDAFTQQKCGVIVTVGGLMTDITKTESQAHPDQKFIGVDQVYDPPLKNVQALAYDTSQVGYLAGYLAAGMTKSGTVGTFGGQKVAPVTIYMDGFAEGIDKYNAVHHKHVKLLGWNRKSQNGSFTNDFGDQDKGKQIAQQFIQAGADIVFPVAGSAGLGAPVAAKAAGGPSKVKVIWVDSDGCVQAKEYCSYFLTSAMKQITPTVMKGVLEAKNGSFKGSNYIGDLKNGGVQLAPYHQFDSKVPAALKKEITQLKAQIIAGKIKVASPSIPK